MKNKYQEYQKAVNLLKKAMRGYKDYAGYIVNNISVSDDGLPVISIQPPNQMNNGKVKLKQKYEINK